jgi:uncharacterized protein YodC (DUF2158 family)
MEAFKPGDVVVLKSGGVQMTVKEVRSEAEIVCIWSDHSAVREQAFPAVVLKQYERPPVNVPFRRG